MDQDAYSHDFYCCAGIKRENVEIEEFVWETANADMKQDSSEFVDYLTTTEIDCVYLLNADVNAAKFENVADVKIEDFTFEDSKDAEMNFAYRDADSFVKTERFACDFDSNIEYDNDYTSYAIYEALDLGDVKIECFDIIKTEQDSFDSASLNAVEEYEFIILKDFNIEVRKCDDFACTRCGRKFDRRTITVLKQLNDCVDFLCNSCAARRLVCGDCHRAFVNKQLLKCHVDAVHLKLKPYTCYHCNKSFARRTDLRIHIDRVHLKKWHKCTECKKEYSHRMHLVEHIDFVHRRLKTVTCDHCHKAFSNRANLKQHYDNIHLRIRKHECAVCGSGFFKKQFLAEHISKRHKTRVQL